MDEKEALFYKKLKNDIVQCQLCPKFCALKPEEYGNCNARKNIGGKLFSIVYGKPCSVAADPVEKKPLYHFLPSTKTLSIATAGCNFHCTHCQNWQISQAKVEDVPHLDISPEKVVEQAKSNKLKSIAFTYTEPTVFYEYMLDTAKLAKKKRIKSIVVSNGFINEKPLKKLIPSIKAANIDLKGNAEFYGKICDGKIEPVLNAIKMLHENKVWLEITNMIVPGYNDDVGEIKKTVAWIIENVGKDVPLHFSAFYPCFKMTGIQATPPEFLMRARIIAKNMGLNYVYTGNISDEDGSTTFCPKCGQAVIRRKNFAVVENRLKNGKCPCGEEIPGIWK
ncbi:MAG: AmmeMemoRadiSam system radical SAM enzyme [Candidatus Paceibacterota bacterium]